MAVCGALGGAAIEAAEGADAAGAEIDGLGGQRAIRVGSRRHPRERRSSPHETHRVLAASRRGPSTRVSVRHLAARGTGREGAPKGRGGPAAMIHAGALPDGRRVVRNDACVGRDPADGSSQRPGGFEAASPRLHRFGFRLCAVVAAAMTCLLRLRG